jgi:peptide/nickel transport system permease protein
MHLYIAKRLLHSLFVLFLVSLIVFILVRLIPGDPVRAMLETTIDITDQKVVEETRAHYGLDKAIPVQFCAWACHFFRGDWGNSLQSGEPVFDMFWRRLPVTLELFLGATLWAWILGFPLGIIGALKRNSTIDASLTSIALIGVSIPSAWEGILLIYFLAVHFRILPPSGFVSLYDDPWLHFESLVMPTFVMGTHAAGLIGRFVRSSLLEVLGQDYIRTAIAKGLSMRAVIQKHAGRPALIPVATVIGLSWGHLLAGAFMVEYIFAIPGLGRMGVDAIFARDFPVIQVMLMTVGVNVLGANIAVDLLYSYLDPRVRLNR